jgi:hypothetical protein
VRSALARSNNTIEERSDDIIKPKGHQIEPNQPFSEKIGGCRSKRSQKARPIPKKEPKDNPKEAHTYCKQWSNKEIFLH